MIDTLTLLKEASYAFLGGPLARGNFREAKSSGYLPFYVNPDAVQIGFIMNNMQNPYGWDGNKLVTDGVDDYVQSDSGCFRLATDYTVYINFTKANTATEYPLMLRRSNYNNRIEVKDDGTKIYISIVNDEHGSSATTETASLGDTHLSIIGEGDVHSYAINDTPSVEIGTAQLVDIQYLINLSGTPVHKSVSDGAIHSAAFFPRALTQEEVTHLHEQSTLGFPGLRADAYGPDNEFARISRTRRRSFGLGSSVSVSVGVM